MGWIGFIKDDWNIRCFLWRYPIVRMERWRGWMRRWYKVDFIWRWRFSKGCILTALIKQNWNWILVDNDSALGWPAHWAITMRSCWFLNRSVSNHRFMQIERALSSNLLRFWGRRFIYGIGMTENLSRHSWWPWIEDDRFHGDVLLMKLTVWVFKMLYGRFNTKWLMTALRSSCEIIFQVQSWMGVLLRLENL